MQSQPWLLLRLREGGGSLACLCFLQEGSSSVVGLTAWLRILPLPGPCFLLECLERQRYPGFTFATEMVHLGGGAQPCSEFGPLGEHLGPGYDPGLGLGAFWDTPKFKFSIRPSSL